MREYIRGGMIFLTGAAAATAEIEVQKDIPYLGPDRAEKMDVYLPSPEVRRPLPVVIWIHGGGWVGGSKSAAREINICTTLAQNGYAAFSIDYKLGTETTETDPAKVPPATVPWPQNIHDCKTAVRFIRKEAVRFGIDTGRLAVSGGSAGGHLALVTAFTGDNEPLNKGGLHTDQSNAVSCVIDFYGPTTITPGKRSVRFAGRTPEETAWNVRMASPVLQISKNTPPVLIVHGTEDKTCGVEFSTDLADKLKAAGVEHQLVLVEGAGHSFHFQPKQMDLRPVVLEFLGKHLAKQP